MNALRLLLALILSTAPLLAADKPTTIVIIGDSTVANYPDNSPNRGWGQFIAGYFNDQVRVVNAAISGRSTKSFRGEAWDKARAEKPDWVLIQFGHNDSHAKTEPKATDATTDYREYLRQYIDESREINAQPILVTPMYRRTFNADGTLQDILQPYADAMKVVGEEKHVPVINLHKMSGELYLQLGEAKCAELANSPTDRTHFGEKGAKEMARLVMSKLAEAAPQLKPLLKP
jgi:lysophospholipase L1-like esterase